MISFLSDPLQTSDLKILINFYARLRSKPIIIPTGRGARQNV